MSSLAISKQNRGFVLTDLILMIDEIIQDELYEKFVSGLIDRTEFQELTHKLTKWQALSQEILSGIS